MTHLTQGGPKSVDVVLLPGTEEEAIGLLKPSKWLSSSLALVSILYGVADRSSTFVVGCSKQHAGQFGILALAMHDFGEPLELVEDDQVRSE